MDNLIDRIKALEDAVIELSKKQGGGGTSGGTVTPVIGETPGGSVNGSNTAFTTASAFTTGSLEVFLNGVRLTKTEDFTEGSSGFTMSVAPLTGDILRVNYYTTTSVAITGGNNLVFNETLTGTVDGSNKDFYTANVFVAGSVMLFRDGQAMKLTDDYTETPASKKISFVSAPDSGSVITAHYLQSVGSPTANADTLDGYHANPLKTAYAIPVTDSNGFLLDTILGGAFTAYTPTTQNMTVGNGVFDCAYKRLGKFTVVRFKFTVGSTTSLSSGFDFSLPVNAVQGSFGAGTVYMEDLGVQGYAGFIRIKGVGTFAPFKYDGTTCSNTIPFTWGNGDFMSGYLVYEGV